MASTDLRRGRGRVGTAAYGLLAPGETGLVKDAAACEWGHGRHRRRSVVVGVGNDEEVVGVAGRKRG